jgi:uncharacterized protein (TIGR03905 family)
MFEYRTRGTCSTLIRFGLEDGRIHSVAFENGCNGNLKGISALVEGMEAERAVSLLK